MERAQVHIEAASRRTEAKIQAAMRRAEMKARAAEVRGRRGSFQRERGAVEMGHFSARTGGRKRSRVR